MQKELIFERKKLFTSWIPTHDLNASQLLYPLSYRCIWLWFSIECYSSFPLHRLRPTTEHKLATTLTRNDKLEGGG